MKRLNRVMKRIRRECMFWGYDLSDMTDEELTDGICRGADKLSRTGISAKNAAERLRKVLLDYNW